MGFEEAFDRIALRALENTGAPSLSVAAVAHGKVAYCKAFGDADETRAYSIASVTKQFTAACVLLMARCGVLSLHDVVKKWFPEVTEAGRISIYHLLTHTSGLPDYYPLSFADDEKHHDATPLSIVEKYARQPLQFEPGTQWSYSNTGYHLAGLIVERVAGMPFGEFLTEHVLQPSGMTDSFFNDPPQARASLLQGYTKYCLGPLRKIAAERAGWTYASGGIASTARDLAHWHTVLMNAQLLTAEELAIVTRPATLKDPGPSQPALGWFCERRGDRRIVQHSGGVAGFSSQTIVSLDSRCSVVVLSNGDHVQTGAIASELFEQLVPGAKPPEAVKPDDPDHARAAAAAWIDALRADSPPDAALLTPEFHAFLDAAHLEDARSGLREAGEVQKFCPIASGERGGMAWYRVRCDFPNRRADAVFRETTDGRLAEFMLYPVA